ncbi:hypothetical protein H9P43_003364 [Blastocladiella emersonii ATCC 22665]|nr:hypothetical protein H9P43_003364 [Blastocladiella emersonii ATCC 22665]
MNTIPDRSYSGSDGAGPSSRRAAPAAAAPPATPPRHAGPPASSTPAAPLAQLQQQQAAHPLPHHHSLPASMPDSPTGSVTPRASNGTVAAAPASPLRLPAAAVPHTPVPMVAQLDHAHALPPATPPPPPLLAGPPSLHAAGPASPAAPVDNLIAQLPASIVVPPLPPPPAPDGANTQAPAGLVELSPTPPPPPPLLAAAAAAAAPAPQVQPSPPPPPPPQPAGTNVVNPPPAEPDFDLEEAVQCPICTEPMTNSGAHRIASLACGHLFGRSCIERWLVPHVRGERKKCPSCNTTATHKQLRNIFATAVVAADTEQLTTLRREIDRQVGLRERAETEIASLKNTIGQMQDEIRNAELKIRAFEQREHRRALREHPDSDRFQTFAWTNQPPRRVAPSGTFRYIAPLSDSETLALSQQLGADHNVLLYSVGLAQAFPVQVGHTKPIRALTASPAGRAMQFLTASADTTGCLVNVHSMSVAMRFQLRSAAWSCCFDSTSDLRVWYGTADNAILGFDLRWPHQPVAELRDQDLMGPNNRGHYIHSLVHVPGGGSGNDGTLVAASYWSVTSWTDYFSQQGGVPATVIAPTAPPARPCTRHPFNSMEPGSKCFAVETCAGDPDYALGFAFRHQSYPVSCAFGRVPPRAPVRIFDTRLDTSSTSTTATRMGMWRQWSAAETGDETPTTFLAVSNTGYNAIDIWSTSNEHEGRFECTLTAPTTTPILDIKPLVAPTRAADNALATLAAINETGDLFLFDQKLAGR